jgi:hypothetical protein
MGSGDEVEQSNGRPWVKHFQADANDWDPSGAERPHLTHQPAGHVTAPDQCCETSENCCQGAVHA